MTIVTRIVCAACEGEGRTWFPFAPRTIGYFFKRAVPCLVCEGEKYVYHEVDDTADRMKRMAKIRSAIIR
jgi:hypothetical protein